MHVCRCLTLLFGFHWVIILLQLHLTPFDSLTSSWLRSLKLSDAVECRTTFSTVYRLTVFFLPGKIKSSLALAQQCAQHIVRSSRHSRFGTSMQTFSADGSLNVCYSAACILHRIQAIALVNPMQCAADVNTCQHQESMRKP